MSLYRRLGPLIPKCEIRMIGRPSSCPIPLLLRQRLNHDLFLKIEYCNYPHFRPELCDSALLNTHNLFLLSSFSMNEMKYHNGRQPTRQSRLCQPRRTEDSVDENDGFASFASRFLVISAVTSSKVELGVMSGKRTEREREREECNKPE